MPNNCVLLLSCFWLFLATDASEWLRSVSLFFKPQNLSSNLAELLYKRNFKQKHFEQLDKQVSPWERWKTHGNFSARMQQKIRAVI